MNGAPITLGGAVASGTFNVAPDEVVARDRAKHEARARERAAEIRPACEALAAAGALPRRRWRDVAHALYCRHIYAQHIEPFQADLTYTEIAARLQRIGIPRFRQGAPWSAQAVAEIRKAVAALREGEILLPDS